MACRRASTLTRRAGTKVLCARSEAPNREDKPQGCDGGSSVALVHHDTAGRAAARRDLLAVLVMRRWETMDDG